MSETVTCVSSMLRGVGSDIYIEILLTGIPDHESDWIGMTTGQVLCLECGDTCDR